MANIFTLENLDDFSEKINLDDLYERKKNYDLNKLSLYNKVLNRIHVRIKTTSRQKLDEQFCWFVVPEVMIGVPRYDNALCISYLLDKLKENGFIVKYIHPNTLFISWFHFVPTYIRNEIKLKTGIAIDETGKKIMANDKEENLDNTLFKARFAQDKQKQESEEIQRIELEQEAKDNVLKLSSGKHKISFKSTDAYKPQGNLVYSPELLGKI
jgi:hypothetical protein